VAVPPVVAPPVVVSPVVVSPVLVSVLVSELEVSLDDVSAAGVVASGVVLVVPVAESAPSAAGTDAVVVPVGGTMSGVRDGSGAMAVPPPHPASRTAIADAINRREPGKRIGAP
jgi:hypothetical protein